MKLKLVLIGILSLMFMGIGLADDIRGYIVPEYYVVGSHHDGEDGIEGQHGFWIRRIYFGYNSDLGKGWSVRVRFEMNSPAFDDGKMEPYIKNAHVKKKIGGGASIIVGIQDPPSFNNIEKWWGMRFLEKTAPDFFKFASSRDLGATIDGKTKGGLVYTVMYGNYSSQKGEGNKGKAFYARLGYETKTAYVEANAHFANDNGDNITYLTAFGGLKGKWGRLGVAYHHINQIPAEGDGKNSGIISGFGVFNLSQQIEIFARYDHFTDVGFKDIGEYVPVPARQWESRFLISGFNIKVHRMVQITPNVKYVFYHGNGAPDGDIHINLTAKISFKTSIGKN